MQTCRQCQLSFDVSAADLEILKKFDAPLPTLCDQCSLQRRLCYRNERHLYRRNCGLCGKTMLTIYRPQSPYQVYCQDCFNGDGWDGLTYGREYDPSRPFFEQFFELYAAVPRMGIYQLGTNENTEFANFSWNAKSCYLTFSCMNCQDIVFSKNVDTSQDCVDCLNLFKGELLYECVDARECYRCAFATRVEKCSHCYLIRDCQDCTDCFGCTNLKHKKYYWYNEPLTKEEYEQRLAKALQDERSFTEERQRFDAFSLQQPVLYANMRNAQDSTGDYLYSAEQNRNCFDCYESENISASYRVVGSKDCYRMSGSVKEELCYESATGPNRSNCIGCAICPYAAFSGYSHSCFHCSEIFGCVGLKKKKHCIFNKQYSEEEYQKLRAEIVANMKKSGEWGEFFPADRSPYPYNDSTAYEFWPLTKDEVLKRGWQWNDDQGGVYGKETMQPEQRPFSLDANASEILKQVVRCESCGLNYKIQGKELELLQSLHLPLPRLCQECRFRRRLNQHNIPPLHQRTCMCERAHTDHAGKACVRSFATTYGPDRKEIVYCEPCYQAEFV